MIFSLRSLLLFIFVPYEVFSLKDTNYSVKNETEGPIVYPMGNMSMKATVEAASWRPLSVEGVNNSTAHFLLLQAHSQSHTLLLSYKREITPGQFVNATNAGLIVPVNNPNAFIYNSHSKNLTVLLFVRAYSEDDPVPGGGALPPHTMPHPYLLLDPQLLTTNVSIPPASRHLNKHSDVITASQAMTSSKSLFSDGQGGDGSTMSEDGQVSSSKHSVSGRNLFKTVVDRIDTIMHTIPSSVESFFRFTDNQTVLDQNSSNASQIGVPITTSAYSESRIDPEDSATSSFTPSAPSDFLPSLDRVCNTTNSSLLYEVFLTYMYEGNMNEDQYWQVLIQTSTPEGLRKYATRVAEFRTSAGSCEAPPSYLFISYSGVGAVISVVVSNEAVDGDTATALTNGSLYSASVSYGCDFIPEEKYRCTKLINPLTQVFCASLLFVGLVLTLFGHRWLNFTMFIAGFFASWFILFVIFIHIPRADIHALGTATFVYSFSCGALWLLLWHKLARPFLSAILIILEAGFLVAMITTHFIKYALVPTPGNLAVFVVIPVLFALLLVAYSIRNIKAVHIFSCVLLGSYAFVIPFAFYFGSTLNYIVINAVAAMTVTGYTSALGFPPFQTCDIVLSSVWVMTLTTGIAYQRYRERNSPPFLPPNLQFWRAAKRAASFLYQQTVGCCCAVATCGRHRGLADDGLRTGLYASAADLQGGPENGVGDSGNGPRGIAADSLFEADEDSGRARSRLSALKTWLSNGLGLRPRTTLGNYHSFPRYPGEDTEDGLGNAEGDGILPASDMDATMRSLNISQETSLSERLRSSLTSLRAILVLRMSRANLFKRRIPSDPDEEAGSSGSSDAEEVDRRAVGIFGDPESEGGPPADDSDADDGQFVDAEGREGELGDGQEHTFGTTQLTLQ